MNGLRLVAAELERHVNVEGWTKEHDARHSPMVLAVAGAAYALDAAGIHYDGHESWKQAYLEMARKIWPFDDEWFKPTPEDAVRQLVKSASMIIAEINRIQAAKRESIGRMELVANTSKESYWVDCGNDDCRWHGLSEDCVHPKNDPTFLLCPDCHDVVEPCDIL